LSFYRKGSQEISFTVEESTKLEIESNSPDNNELKDRPLTKRQRTIMALIQEGLTNSQIAGEIGYSESLVRQESVLIYAKLGIRGRVDLRAESSAERVSR
jgi:DNA-binding NarL/FixJ family response regulator